MRSVVSLGPRPALAGTPKGVIRPRQADDPGARGELGRAAERVAFALDHQRRNPGPEQFLRPGALGAAGRVRVGRPAARQASAPTVNAVRQATRAPAERPPTTSGPAGRSAASTAVHAASNCLGGPATLQPGQRRHGCSTSTTLTPLGGSAAANATRSRASMPPPAPWPSTNVPRVLRAQPCTVARAGPTVVSISI